MIQDLTLKAPMTTALTHPDYPAFLAEMKKRILQARNKAVRSVNNEMILLYWDIGRGIVVKQQTAGWGDSVVERFSVDLRAEFPDMRGFSSFNLWRMRQLYLEYSSPEFLAQAVPELGKSRGRFMAQAVPELARRSGSTKRDQFLSQFVRELLAAVPWGHHVELLKKIKVPAARIYYLRATARFGWSRNVLLNQIKAGISRRTGGRGDEKFLQSRISGHSPGNQGT
jgi:predicted nuclease of restriction endonuclease-like (RecB) superfamily